MGPSNIDTIVVFLVTIAEYTELQSCKKELAAAGESAVELGPDCLQIVHVGFPGAFACVAM